MIFKTNLRGAYIMNNKLTSKEFVELVGKSPVAIDKRVNYVAVKVNSENIAMSDKLKDQLVKENKYDNTYIGFMTSEVTAPYSMDNLPIYGRSDIYETKHFSRDFAEAVMTDLRQRSMGILNRHHEYQVSQ